MGRTPKPWADLSKGSRKTGVKRKASIAVTAGDRCGGAFYRRQLSPGVRRYRTLHSCRRSVRGFLALKLVVLAGIDGCLPATSPYIPCGEKDDIHRAVHRMARQVRRAMSTLQKDDMRGNTIRVTGGYVYIFQRHDYSPSSPPFSPHAV